VTDISEK